MGFKRERVVAELKEQGYVRTESVSSREAISSNQLTAEQETQWTKWADEVTQVFGVILKLKNASAPEHRPIMSVFYQTALKENDVIQKLLVETRDASESQFEILSGQIRSELERLSDTRDAAVSKANELSVAVNSEDKEEVKTASVEVQKPVETVRLNVKSSSAESDVNMEYIESLVDGYSNKDLSVFYSRDGRIKKTALIEKEIRRLVEYSGSEPEKVEWLFRLLQRPFELLQESERDALEKRAGKLLRTRNGENHKEYAFNIANIQLKEMIESVSGFLQMEKIEKAKTEEAVSSRELVVDVDKEIAYVSSEYTALLENAKMNGFDKIGSKAASAVGVILDALIPLRNEDAPVAKILKEKYLKGFKEQLENLKLEVEEYNNLAVSKEVTSNLESPNSEHSPNLSTGPVFSDEDKAEANDVESREVNLQVPVLDKNEFSLSSEAVELTNNLKPILPVSVELKDRSEHWNIKDEYKQKEAEYKSAMEAFYQDKSLVGKARHTAYGVGKLFGMKPVLPESILTLQREYKENRQLYAASLDLMIAERAAKAESKPGEYREYDSSADSTKIAFGRKFILKPNEELLRLQAREIMSPENKARLARVMELMKKHKTAFRVGMVLGAGVLAATSAVAAGAATAGVVAAGGVGAGTKAARMATSIALGAGSGMAAKKFTQAGVDTAWANFATAKSDVTAKFTLDDLNKLEEILQSAEYQKSRAESVQKSAMVGAAVLTGGATMSGMSQVDSFDYTGEANSGPEALMYNMKPEEAEGSVVGSGEMPHTSDPLLWPESRHSSIQGSNLSPEAAQLLASWESVSVTPEASEVSSFTLEEELTFNHYGDISGEFEGSTILRDIKLEGSNLDKLNDVNKAKLESSIKLTADRLLGDIRNITKPKLEQEVFQIMHNKYGKDDWFTEAGLTKVSIGSIKPVPAAVVEVSETTPETTLSQEEISEYEIKKGDTLWEITSETFSSKLAGLNPIERNEVIDSVMDKIQANPELMKSIGIRGDVDEIFTGEKINMEVLQDEIDKAVDRSKTLENPVKSSALKVESDVGIKDVPIKVKVNIQAPEVMPEPATVTQINLTPNVPGFSEETVSKMEVGTAGVLSGLTASVDKNAFNKFMKKTLSPIERVSDKIESESNSGNKVDKVNFPDSKSFDDPKFKRFLENTYGSLGAFSRVLNREVEAFDNRTYDFFERIGSDYESPYKLLSDVSMKDLSEYKKPENLEELKSLLKDENIKYETYLAWMDLIDQLKAKYPNTSMTTVSDLFSRSVAETEIPKPNRLTT